MASAQTVPTPRDTDAACPADPISDFPDTSGSPFRDDIDRLADQGTVGGFPDGTYRPSDDVRRDQMASFIARGLDFAITEGLVLDLLPGFEEPCRFTTEVTPEQVVDEDDTFRRGEPGSAGTFDLRLDADSDTIGYDITLEGVSGGYASPAATATHIHGNDFGLIGPPVVAFDNPQPVDAGDPDGLRRNSGCVDATAPAFTGTATEWVDNSLGATLADIEEDPADDYVDVHTEAFQPGAVRGQFTPARPVTAPPAVEPSTSTRPVSAASAPSATTVGQDREVPEGMQVCHVEPV